MDFFRFCAFRVPDMKNMEDIVKCMDLHLEDLCPPCKEMVQNATSALSGFHAACDASLTAQVRVSWGLVSYDGSWRAGMCRLSVAKTARCVRALY